MCKKRRTIALSDPQPYNKHAYVFVNSDTGEICECQEIVPLLEHIARAVDDGEDWKLYSLRKGENRVR